MQDVRTISLLAVLMLLGSLAATAAKMTIIGPTPPQPFLDAVKQAGYAVETGALPTEGSLIVVVTPFGQNERDRQALAAQLTDKVLHGASLLVSLGMNPDHAKCLEAVLPVNCWSFDTASKGGLRRGASEAAELPGFLLSGRYDLHLPYAAIEAGEHRYQWERYGKELLNTDWQVELTAKDGSMLPLEVSGRYGAGRVRLLGYDLYDATLQATPGYAAYTTKLLAGLAPVAAGPAANVPALPLRIARHQVGKLEVQVVNDTAEPVDALLAYKVRNAEHVLLNSAAVPVKVPAKSTLTVPLVERSPLLGDAQIAATGDALPYRYIDAGLVAPNRTAVLSRASRLVDTSPAVTLAMVGEDIRTFDDLKNWPDRRNGPGKDMAGGAPIYRYTYFTGTTPSVTVALRNGLHNIAPLAQAADEQWPENPSVEGLNDLAYSHGSLRDWQPRRIGVWAGKPAATQQLTLRWDAPVTIAGQGLIGMTDYRRWERSNPRQYVLNSLDIDRGAALAEVKDAPYTAGRHYARLTTTTLSACRLTVQGLDEKADIEPRPVGPSNCALTEWEVYGWPGAQPPARVAGQLTITATDLLTRQTQQLVDEPVTLESLAELTRTVTLPTRQAFGPVRVEAVFTANDNTVTRASFDVLFIAPDRDAIVATAVLGQSEIGLLCSPGFLLFDEFGKGTNDDTQGWGGDDDKIWALTHDFMELGTRSVDTPTRLFTTSARFCHYTNPWREYPDGSYFWHDATDKLEAMVTTGKFKGTKSLRVFFSDRWNGVPINASFTWADFISFDQYLREKGGKGLQSRSRKQVINEITSQYADQWQIWQLNRYADALLATQERLAKVGVAFSVTTHGSFPLAGGELGAKLAKTHKASGTDLFWELRNEDLYFSIGQRFGLIAANPDLESGAYNEWGWVSAVLNNPHWYAETGTVEPSRRQWYSTYFAGRVTTAGTFKPLATYGYDAQGGFGTKNTANDWQQYYRTMQFTTRVRPEQPTGIGLVISWREQERRMGAKAGPLGFGIYAAEGNDQIDALGGEVYQKLVKCGVPISFVASTHTLRNWQGTQPLIVVNAFNLEPWEIAELDRLNRGGAPIIGLGTGVGDGSTLAEQFFQVKAGVFTALPGAKTRPLTATTSAIAAKRNGCAPTLFYPVGGKALTSDEAARLAQEIRETAGNALEVSPGAAVTAFISNDRLFLTVNDQGDRNRAITVDLIPSRLKADYTGRAFRVIDLDSARELPVTWNGDRLRVTLPTAASDGRLVMVVKD